MTVLTNSAGKIPSLDGIRAVSILIVFADHAGLPQIVRGSTGVTIFFFLSGYLITTLMLAEQDSTRRIDIRGFYVRRALRIFPAMYLTLAAALLLAAAGVVGNTADAGGTIAAALHGANYWIVYEGRDGIPTGMNALWSLAVEEHYYVLFPILFILVLRKLSARNAGVVIACICAVELVWRCVLWFFLDADFDRLYLATDTRIDSILFGALMAFVFNPWRDGRLLPSRGPGQLMLIGLALFASVRVMPPSLALTIGYTIEGIGLIFLFTALISEPSTWYGRVLNWRPVAFLGVLSYAFYLNHRLVLTIVHERTSMDPYAGAAVAFAGSVAAAYVVYRLVETPLAGLRRRLRRREDPLPVE